MGFSESFVFGRKPSVMLSGDSLHRIRYLTQKLNSGLTVALEFDREDFSQPLGLTPFRVRVGCKLDSNVHKGAVDPGGCGIA